MELVVFPPGSRPAGSASAVLPALQLVRFLAGLPRGIKCCLVGLPRMTSREKNEHVIVRSSMVRRSPEPNPDWPVPIGGLRELGRTVKINCVKILFWRHGKRGSLGPSKVPFGPPS